MCRCANRRFNQHNQTLLDAKEFYVSLNTLSLITGKASIHRMILTRHQQVSTLTVWATVTSAFFGKGQKRIRAHPARAVRRPSYNYSASRILN